MGTVLPDFYYPEFILLGHHDEVAQKKVVEFYATITDAPVYTTTLENAEMIKVSYNTFITAKICLANTIMMMCDKLPNTNCDEVMKGLFLGKNRIISEKYMTGGMGDGGGCHPRDNIALSWLSDQLGLNFNFYDGLMTCREDQTEYFVDLIVKYQRDTQLPIVLLGKSFKPETTLCVGSPAILLRNLLEARNIPILMHFDPYTDDAKQISELVPAIYFLSTRHEVFQTYKFPAQSVVIDPFRMLKNLDIGVIYHPIGAGKGGDDMIPETNRPK
jgi:UDPglucose 6-dehydrogenase